MMLNLLGLVSLTKAEFLSTNTNNNYPFFSQTCFPHHSPEYQSIQKILFGGTIGLVGIGFSWGSKCDRGFKPSERSNQLSTLKQIIGLNSQ